MCQVPPAPVYIPVGHECLVGEDPVCLSYLDVAELGMYIRDVADYEAAVNRCEYVQEVAP